MEDQDREIASTLSFPPFYQWRIRGRTGHSRRVHLKGIVYHKSPAQKVTVV